MTKEITLREEVEKYLRNRRIVDLELAVTGYLCGCAEVFAHAYTDASLCANGAPMGVREKLNPPKTREHVYRGAMHTLNKFPRHLPEHLREEFSSLVERLAGGEQIPAEKAKLVAGVLQEYMKDYLGGIGSVQCYGEMPR